MLTKLNSNQIVELIKKTENAKKQLEEAKIRWKALRDEKEPVDMVNKTIAFWDGYICALESLYQ